MMSMHIRHWKGKLSLAVEKIGDFFFQAQDGIRELVRTRWLGVVYKTEDENRDLVRSRGLGDVYKGQREYRFLRRVTV